MTKPIVIAIDGPAAAGKGTIARQLAADFDYAYLDTGSLYRAVALGVIAEGAIDDEALAARISSNLDLALTQHPDLRTEATGRGASIVSAMPKVRANLLALQRDFAATPPGGKNGAILDGRDIGTVICPKADAKLFVTASAEVRARRRMAEEKKAGKSADYVVLLADVKARDARDTSREDAPLRPAQDADLLDTSELTIEAAIEQAKRLIKAATE